MSHNAITNFGRNPFARNQVLGWLSLSHNQLTKIDARTFRSMRFLRRLYLSDNQITSVSFLGGEKGVTGYGWRGVSDGVRVRGCGRNGLCEWNGGKVGKGLHLCG